MSKGSNFTLIALVLVFVVGFAVWQTGCTTTNNPSGNTNTNTNANDNANDNSGQPIPGDQCPDDPDKTEPGACGCGVADIDSDNDGAYDCNDECPTDGNKVLDGECGCGVADVDSDNDGTLDCNDECPADANKTEAGVCGCGVAETDADSDGTLDCNDQCPNDANKTEPGACGCGESELDSDEDGVPNCNDECIYDENKTDAGECGCGNLETDTDNDGTPDCVDSCPSDATKTTPGNCGCGTPEGECGPASVEVIETTCYEPFIVRSTIRIEDWQGNAITSGVYNSYFEISENDLQLNPLESPVYIVEGESRNLKMMLILDYSLTMNSINAIDDMVDSASAFLNDSRFNEYHQAGVIEFHQRHLGLFEEGYSLISSLMPLTDINKEIITTSIPDENNLDHGNSRLWDAVLMGIDEIANSGGDKDQETRVILVITTGYAAASVADASDAISDAKDEDIQIYTIKLGNVASADTAGLQEAASETGGQYYAVGDPNDLDNLFTGDIDTEFDQIVTNLMGQWVLNYITPLPAGSDADVEVDFTWGAYTTGFELDDYCSNSGDPNIGMIEIIEGEYDSNNTVTTTDDTKTFILKAHYLPSGINSIKFGLGHSATWQTGSLLSGWGTFTADAGEPSITGTGTNDAELPFGGFGEMGTITITGEGDVGNTAIGAQDFFIEVDPGTLPGGKNINFCSDEPIGFFSPCPY